VHPVLHSFAIALLVAASSAPAQVRNSARPSGLTIVMDFQGPHSERSIAEMKREFETILAGSGVALDWRMRRDLVEATYPDMIVVRFKGKCVMEPVGYLYDERGPLAFTHSTDGRLLPFSEVACDNVTRSIRSAMWGGDFRKGDQLLGRALGRVVAHEVVHILGQSAGHGKQGVSKTSLSGSDLIASELPLTPQELERMFSASNSR
jgi:hypothetical protein